MSNHLKQQILKRLELADPYLLAYRDMLLPDMDKLPNEVHGWGDMDLLREEVCREKPTIALEVGSWLGQSSITIAKALPENGCLICVDTWLGSAEHWVTPKYKSYMFTAGVPTLYPKFLQHTRRAEVSHKIVPLRLPSDTAFEILSTLAINPQFFYIDGCHETYQVERDIENALQIASPGVEILCDDYDWDSVKQAIGRVCFSGDGKRLERLCATGNPIGPAQRVFRIKQDLEKHYATIGTT